jgi:hypothetical protein
LFLDFEKGITELAKTWLTEKELTEKQWIPLPRSKFIVRDEQWDSPTITADEKRMVGKEEKLDYLKQVGSVLWFHGLRFDISFSLMYATWYTYAPRGLNMELSKRLIQHMHSTKDVPLVLGGRDPIQVISITDSSLGTGPKYRSVNGLCNRLGPQAGAISGGSKASDSVHLFSCSDELGGYTNAVKSCNRIRNILQDMEIPHDPVAVLVNDNEKSLGFVRGESGGEGMKHAERQLFYMRGEVDRGRIEPIWESGLTIVADAMTKPKTAAEQRAHCIDIQGLRMCNGWLPVSLRETSGVVDIGEN